ncbi:hypothetical protein H5410_003311, partial [Solanum commersonii]
VNSFGEPDLARLRNSAIRHLVWKVCLHKLHFVLFKFFKFCLQDFADMTRSKFPPKGTSSTDAHIQSDTSGTDAQADGVTA